MDTKSKILNTLFNQEVIASNKKTFENLDYYRNAKSIIERTNIALGRNKGYKEISLSTINSQFDTNAIKSTQKI